jgi:multidrug efflux pump subunit AcrA (membrane-fusion protein)
MKKNVYSSLGSAVKSVCVAVGDSVSEGQVLCRLDTEEIEFNLSSQRLELKAAQRSNTNQLESSEFAYGTAAESLKKGTNAGILSAEAALKSADASLKSAKKAYADALDEQGNPSSSGKATAQSALRSAEIDLGERRAELEANRQLYEAGAISQDALAKLESACASAQARLSDAQAAARNAETAELRAVERARESLDSAQLARESAATSLASAREVAGQELERYRNSVTGAQISANIDSRLLSIERLERQLESATVTAPAAGVVTAVYAKVGAIGSGLLFVVEDTERLLIRTKIKEIDAGRVTPGMPVVIKSDSSGDAELSGALMSIDPAAIKDANGETMASSDVEFAAMVSVTQAGAPLKIGMNARLNIIAKQRDDIYYVPFDAVTTDENGEPAVYIAVPDGNGGSVARKAVVREGMHTDFYVEIEGEGIEDGANIIKDVAEIGVFDGMPIFVRGAA